MAVDVTGLIGVFHIAKTDAPSMIVIAYRGRVAGSAQAAPGAEMLEVGTFSLGSLPPLAFPSHRTVVAEYLKSLAPAEEAAPRPDREVAPRARRPSRGPAPTQPRHRR